MSDTMFFLVVWWASVAAMCVLFAPYHTLLHMLGRVAEAWLARRAARDPDKRLGTLSEDWTPDPLTFTDLREARARDRARRASR